MTADIRVVGDEIVVTPAGGRLPEMKTLGASWRDGAWRLPAAEWNARQVEDALGVTVALPAAAPPPLRTAGPAALYPFQVGAAAWLASRPRGGLLCMSPGLGKTPTAITAAEQVVQKHGAVLVVAPASLLANWNREIDRWARRRDVEWSVESWDRAARLATFGGKGEALSGYDVVILDESVMAKSRRSMRFKALSKARRWWKHVWLLSGSPTTRYADDLWSQLNLIWPKAFRSYWRFAERYCVVEEGVWARKVVATRGARDVLAENADLIHVVSQEDVLDLPEYLFEVVDVQLTGRQAAAYARMARDFVAELDGEEIVAQNEISRLAKLQQIASFWDGQSAKHDAVLDLLPGYQSPYLIWTHWREGGDALALRLADAGYTVGHVSGGLPAKMRDRVLEDFKAGHLQALVLSVGVGKFGHTLTNARTIIYVDKTWNADDYFQSLHRVRRIGLEHRPVVVTVRAPGTIDELVEENLEGKLGGISRLTKSSLRDLLAGLGKETS